MIISHVPEIILITILTIFVGAPYIFYLRWYVPRKHQQGMEEARARVERLRREEADGVSPSATDYHYAIFFDSNGFTITDLRSQKHETVAMSWSDVCQATAFKRDLFTIDCVCLHLSSADGAGVEVDEDMAGWKRLMNGLPMHLPGSKPYSEWFPAVAYPAFVPNTTEIYLRKTNQNAEQKEPFGSG